MQKIKELLDEYAIISRDDEDFYPNTERMQEIIKEIEASVRMEVVEDIEAMINASTDIPDYNQEKLVEDLYKLTERLTLK